MPIQNVPRDNVFNEAFFYEFFRKSSPDVRIENWMYETCYGLDDKAITKHDAIEETVELKRIIGICQGCTEPDTYREERTKNWLGIFCNLSRRDGHKDDPFGSLSTALDGPNMLSLYKVIIGDQPYYFISQGKHRTIFLKIKGEQFHHFKTVVPITLNSDKAILF